MFYEVGYAHAVNKVVILLTQRADDIPFDLRHRPHIIYGGKIKELRAHLATRIAWALQESRRRRAGIHLTVSLEKTDIPEQSFGRPAPALRVEADTHDEWFWFLIHNNGPELFEPVAAYLLTGSEPGVFPINTDDAWREKVWSESYVHVMPAAPEDQAQGLALQWRLDDRLHPLPVGTEDWLRIRLRWKFAENDKNMARSLAGRFCLRLHGRTVAVDFPFEMTIFEPPPKLLDPKNTGQYL